MRREARCKCRTGLVAVWKKKIDSALKGAARKLLFYELPRASGGFANKSLLRRSCGVLARAEGSPGVEEMPCFPFTTCPILAERAQFQLALHIASGRKFDCAFPFLSICFGNLIILCHERLLLTIERDTKLYGRGEGG